MADVKNSRNPKFKIRSKRGFKPDIYMRIGDDQLITLSLKLLIENGKTSSFENLTEEAYRSFPQKFCIPNHPEWPDTLVIDRSVRRCATERGKRWIAGRAAVGFKLMPAGETIAADTFKKLEGKKPLAKALPRGGRQTQSARVVKHIESSAAFKKFQLGRGLLGITEFELCDLLYCTIESTPDTFDNNLSVLVSNVKDFRREDLMPFLEGLRRRFGARFPQNALTPTII
jgi:hypothetical protein